MCLTNGHRRFAIRLISQVGIVVALAGLLSLMVLAHRMATSGRDDATVAAMFDDVFDDADRRTLDATLRTVVDVLERLNVSFFMGSGTLLGSYRHHGRIPWDDDVDLLLDAAEKRRVFAALTSLWPEYGLFLSGLIDAPYHWKFYPRRDAVGRSIALKPFRWPFVDLMFYAGNATHVWNESPWFSATEVWPRADVFPLVRRPLDDLWLPAPCDSRAVLESQFRDVTDGCVSRSWNHVVDLPMLPGSAVRVPCSTLAGRYRFVRQRDRNATSAVESLALANRTVVAIRLPIARCTGLPDGPLAEITLT